MRGAGRVAGALFVLGLAACAHAPPRVGRPLERAPRAAPSEPGFLGEGLASFYGPGLYGRKTASGERLERGSMTAAHRSLRFGTCVRVVNVRNGRAVRVRINDRGPFVPTRIMDLSELAARRLGITERGVARVRLYLCGVGEEPVGAREQAPGPEVAWAF